MKKIISLALAMALPFALIATADAYAGTGQGKVAKAIGKPAKTSKMKKKVAVTGKKSNAKPIKKAVKKAKG